MAVVLDRRMPVDLSPNASAPLAPWAPELQARGRFEDRGRGPDAFDCMGLVVFVQRLIGRPAPDYLDLYRALDIRDRGDVDALFRAESAAWRNVSPGAPGDVLVLGAGAHAHHVAVLCGAGRALHARPQAGLAIETIEGRARVSRFAGHAVFACVAPC